MGKRIDHEVYYLEDYLRDFNTHLLRGVIIDIVPNVVFATHDWQVNEENISTDFVKDTVNYDV